MLRLFFYVATAGSFAAGASDMVDNAVASALGNFGILLILYRLYVLSPLLVARSSAGNDQWVDGEAQWVETTIRGLTRWARPVGGYWLSAWFCKCFWELLETVAVLCRMPILR